MDLLSRALGWTGLAGAPDAEPGEPTDAVVAPNPWPQRHGPAVYGASDCWRSD